MTSPPPNLAAGLAALRPSDLLIVNLAFHHFDLAPPAGGQPARLIPRGTHGDPPMIFLGLPPQAIGEAVLPAAGAPVQAGEIRAAYAEPGQLVFVVEPDSDPIEYRLEAVLERCRELPLRLPATVAPDAVPVDPWVTTIEVPYGLVLSPGKGARWRHAATAVRGASGHVELWHTRLADDKSVTAVGNAVRHPLDTVETGLDASARRRLVEHTAEGHKPVQVREMLLSALGAWLDVHGDWSDGTAGGNPLVSWRHRMTMGRDQFVEVVTAGFLFPFGHRAVHVETTERQIEADADGTLTAFLRTRSRLFVREPERRYDEEGVPPAEHRQLPFTAVTLATVATPELLPESADAIPTQVPGPGNAFWPKVEGPDGTTEDVQFHLVAIDREGQTVAFTTPLAFLAADTAADDARLHTWMTSETSDFGIDGRRFIGLGGQRVAFAVPRTHPPPPAPSDSTFETATVEIGVKLTAAPSRPFRPVLRTARATVPAIRAATNSPGEVLFRYDETYVAGEHPLDVFAQLLPQSSVRVEFGSAEQSGGLARPSFPITRLSRTLGPVGAAPVDPGGLPFEGKFDPDAFFGDAFPTLLGVLQLDKLLMAQDFAHVDGVFGSGPKLPRLATTSQGPVTRTELQWETELPGLAAGATLSVAVARETSEGAPPTFRSEGTITGFSVSVPPDHPLVTLPINSLSFTAKTGRKPDVGAVLGDLVFTNELAFVNALADILDAVGFDDPPAVSVTDQGIEVGYTLGIPSVPLGVFTLQNLGFSAGLALPLLDARSPSLRLDFAKRHNPCIVTFGAFGGGAFVGLLVGLQQIEILEGSIEFGGGTAIDLGVASGGVAVRAGISYAMLREGETVSYRLAGFLRCVGALEVLGIISISVEFYLELAYDSGTNRLSGTASLSVEVEFAFFSKTVRMTVHREFAGSGAAAFAALAAAAPGDGAAHTFRDVVPDAATWATYCRAFEGVA